MTSQRVRVVVSGRVQGVWFRDSCRERARVERVGGWVRNRSDGSVEAEFEGHEDAVARMVAWCRQGPPRANVTDMTTAALEPIGEQAFRIR